MVERRVGKISRGAGETHPPPLAQSSSRQAQSFEGLELA